MQTLQCSEPLMLGKIISNQNINILQVSSKIIELMNAQTKSSGSIEVTQSSFNSLTTPVSRDISNKSDLFLSPLDFIPENSFIASFSALVTSTKLILEEKVQKLRSQKWNIEGKKVQRQLLAKLTDSLSILEKQAEYLVADGILLFLLGLLDIQEKFCDGREDVTTSATIKEIIKESSSLLKQYFIYHEYKHKKQQSSHLQEEMIFTCRSLNIPAQTEPSSSSKTLKDDQPLFKQIRRELGSLSINELIINYMQKEIVEIQQKQEVCRICSQKVKLEKIGSHLKLCRKISHLKERIQQQTARQLALINEARSLLNKIQKQIKSEENEILKKIIGMLLVDNKTKRQKKIRKRSNSNGGSRSDRELTSKWEFLLEQYEQTYGEHEVLSEITKVQREKLMLERNLRGLEEIIVFESFKPQKNVLTQKLEKLIQRNPLAELQSSISSDITLSQKIIEMQMFEPKDQILSDSEDSQADSNKYSVKMQSFESLDQKLKSIRSRRILSKQNDLIESEDKNYVSLQKIPQESFDNKLSLQNFQILKVLGQGAFGKVYLVRRKNTRDLYALKIIKLSENNWEKDLQSIKNQHEIFKKIAGDHLVKAPFSFSEKGSHIFVLQFMPGGDLRKLLTEQIYFEEDAARFYLAEIVVAIEYLHKHQIIHRDLKPENLVIDQQGHLKLTDFGLSAISLKKRLRNSLLIEKESSEIVRTNKRRAILKMEHIHQANIIGTPDYLAPQIINHISTSNKSIDWWSLGVIAYELLIGARPFAGDTIQEVIENIRCFNLEWPEVGYQDDMISPEAKDLIEKLLNKDIMSRLGADGADEIKSHVFFKGINWANIKNQKPPLVPSIRKIDQFANCLQNRELRDELESKLGHRPRHSKGIKLQKFVRYDLLGSETMESFQKIFNEEAAKLRKLRTCRGFDLEKSEF